MIKKKLAIASALAVVGIASAWATAGRPGLETAVEQREMNSMLLESAAADDAKSERLFARATLSAKRADALDVGDADSFGKPVKWLGLMSSPPVALAADCSSYAGTDTRCLQLVNGHVVAEVADLGHMTLPGKSIDNFICHWQSPFVSGRVRGQYGESFGRAYVNLYPVIRIASPVLDDPALIDPATGEPLNGAMDVYQSSVAAETSVPPGATAVIRNTASRTCIGGILNRKSLKEYYGLSDAQVRDMFAQPITLTLRATVSARNVDSAFASVGYRFTGN